MKEGKKWGQKEFLRHFKSRFGLEGSHSSFHLVFVMILFYFFVMLSYTVVNLIQAVTIKINHP